MRIAGRLLCSCLLVIAVLVPAVPARAAAAAPGRSVVVLREGQSWRVGRVFRWGGWTLRLTRGGLALYKPNGDAQWYTNTGTETKVDRLAFQHDGNLVLYTRANKPVWWTGTSGLGLTDGVFRLHWATNMGRCTTGQPGALQLSGVLGDGTSSYVWTSCSLSTMLPNSALSRSGTRGSSLDGVMASPGNRNFLVYGYDGSLYIMHFNSAGPPATVLWQAPTAGLQSVLFGFNPERDGPALYNGPFGKPVWTEHGITAAGVPYRWFAMQDDANLVLYASSDRAHTQNIRAIWSSGWSRA